MTRILADLPDDEIKRLDRLATEQGKSQSEVLREAILWCPGKWKQAK